MGHIYIFELIFSIVCPVVWHRHVYRFRSVMPSHAEGNMFLIVIRIFSIFCTCVLRPFFPCLSTVVGLGDPDRLSLYIVRQGYILSSVRIQLMTSIGHEGITVL